MVLDRSGARVLGSLFSIVWLCSMAAAQAPPSIQFFMPDGSLPPRELRFNMVSEDGRVVDTFFTDSKGRFLITRSQGLRANTGYTITVPGDGRTFDTTTFFFRFWGDTVYYVPVFLKPLETKTPAPRTINLAELDVLVPAEARAAYEQGMQALKDRKVDEALAHLKRAIKLHPGYFRALNDLGVLHMKLNRLEAAAEYFSRAIQIAPRVYHPRLNLGIVRHRQGKHKEAIELLEQLRKEQPNVSEVLVPLADVLSAAGRLEQAELRFREALGYENPESPAAADLHHKIGTVLNRRERFEDAIGELTKATRLRSGSAQTRFQLGAAFLGAKRLAEAEQELLEAYRIGGSKLGAAQFLLGQTYFLRGKHREAIEAFERYLVDIPHPPNEREVRAAIARLRQALETR